ncbi:MAG: hypothetical protein KJ043_22775, partial [Anaerolineae bacterium]|nr:hypothetical protein [Anaerolineae bacterium]
KIKTIQDAVLPLDIRQRLVVDAKPVIPDHLLPNPLPEGVNQLEALATVVWALAQDGATLEQDGLLPKHALQDGPVEQNRAREIALETFPPEARLRKVGMEAHRKRLILTFDFPERAPDKWMNLIDQLEDVTGWEVHLTPATNQQALGEALHELLPKGARLVKSPSYYMDRREVIADVAEITPDVLASLKRMYLDLTGFKLVTGNSTPANNNATPAPSETPTTGKQMEINAAYGLIRAKLGDKGLYKTSLKGNGIVLAFISPQVGGRYYAEMNELAQQTGYPLSVHPHPNQQEILSVANRLIREAGWSLKKGIGIHTDRGEVSVTLTSAPDEVTLLTVLADFLNQTGYLMVVNVG